MKTKVLYYTDPLAKALRRASYLAEKSQHQLIIQSIVDTLYKLKDAEIDKLCDEHTVEVGIREDELREKRG